MVKVSQGSVWLQVNPGKTNLQEKTEWHRVVIFNEGLVNVVQQYLKKGANVYIEGALTTRKWKDESSGQDKYSTEVVLQGYNSSLTMLDGKSKGENSNLVSENKSSLPNDETQTANNDLDDEIPF
jgi:single-strand DNA-binding protein